MYMQIKLEKYHSILTIIAKINIVSVGKNVEQLTLSLLGEL